MHLPPVPGTQPGTANGADRDRERDGDVPEAGEEREEADRLLAGFGKLARDLEYSPGLPEPRQQAVMPQPEPWRRDPSREGPSPVIDGVAPLRVRAAGGDRVEIRGRNLRVVQVMFGTAPARLLGSSGTLVSVEAPPASAGPVTIAVTNDDGTWAIAQVPVVYVE